jgi:N-acetylneuraminate synthase
MSTPFSTADAEAIDPYVKRHKLASYEIFHTQLLEWLAGTGKPLILSSGGASLEEIEGALAHFARHGGQNITLLQCTAKYPAPLSTLNLHTIPFMRDYFGIPVGLSDHSREPLTGPLGAVAMGASVIEKHFTLHNALPGPDHKHAVTADELKDLVRAIRAMEQAKGEKSKVVQPDEEELREFAMRGLQATRNIQKGETLSLGVNVDILRPGQKSRGIHPKHSVDIEGCLATRDIPAGEGIHEGDYA